MSEARTLPGPWDDTDVALVVHTLHRSGPLPLTDLLGEPTLEGWGSQRIEHAVVTAWSRNLISFDQRDLLVAL